MSGQRKSPAIAAASNIFDITYLEVAMMDRKEIEKLRDDARSKADRYFNEYQESGIPSKEKLQHKNEDLAEALTLALDYEQMRIEERERRARNASLFADRLEDRKYTKSEVKELILNFCWG